MARKKSERQEPKLEIRIKKGEISHEEVVKTAALILYEMLTWDYGEDEKVEQKITLNLFELAKNK